MQIPIRSCVLAADGKTCQNSEFAPVRSLTHTHTHTKAAHACGALQNINQNPIFASECRLNNSLYKFSLCMFGALQNITVAGVA
jgi:hypothetical protein